MSIRLLLALGCCLLGLSFTKNAVAQHCAPLFESYLNELSIREIDESLELQFVYAKTGGQHKRTYQAYLVAFLDEDFDPKHIEGDIIDPNSMVVLKTSLIERKGETEGRYAFKYSGELKELSDKLLELRKRRQANSEKQDDSEENAQASEEKAPVILRMFFFVPYLEDETYSTLEGLPEEKHECNYRGAKALIIQKLPYEIVIKKRLEDAGEETYFSWINPHPR